MAQSTSYSSIPKGNVPPPAMRYTRYPFLFLVDTSGSTGFDHQAQGLGPQADIHQINRAIQGMLGKLRYPETDELKSVHEGLEVCVVTYNSRYDIELPWTRAPDLNPSLHDFVPDGMTHTYAALTFAFGYIADRLRYYRDQNLKFGRPYVLHFTDGAPTDMKPGDAYWKEIQSRISNLIGTAGDPEKKLVDLRHMVTHNAVDPTRSQIKLDANRCVTGFELLTELSGKKSAFALDDHPDMVTELVDFVTQIIIDITTSFGASEADPDDITQDAARNAKHIKSADDILDADDDAAPGTP